jgi:uncharacterized BrkB/YihY/UPF0761 family membrane protein
MEGNLPPIPKLVDYPGTIGIGLDILFTIILVYFASRFDPTFGTLTISLVIVLAFLGVVIFCLFFAVPTDEITSAVIGGLVAAFGAVVVYWLSKPHNPK